jgi:hypothetical protein
MLGAGLRRLCQHIGQQPIGQILRPAHRLGGTELIPRQVVEDLVGDLLGRRGNQRRQLGIEHKFDTTTQAARWPTRVSRSGCGFCPGQPDRLDLFGGQVSGWVSTILGGDQDPA